MLMTLTLIAILAGLLLGGISAGGVSLILFLSRSYRKVNNRIVIHLAQLCVAVFIVGGLISILAFAERLGFQRHSSGHYAALWAYLIACVSVLFISFRADLRWQESVGLYRKTRK
jgi:hypothetical protein